MIECTFVCEIFGCPHPHVKRRTRMHTPGPWTVEVLQELTAGGERMPASYISSSQGWANSGMAGKRTIAIVGHWKDRPNPESDAALIAAAPELLDVVRDCVNFLADLNSPSPEGSIYFDSEYMTHRAKSLHKRAYTAHSKAKDS